MSVKCFVACKRGQLGSCPKAEPGLALLLALIDAC